MPLNSAIADRELYRKCRLSGRNCGECWRASSCALLRGITSTGWPPPDGTRNNGEVPFGANTIVPSAAHVPPPPRAASQISTGGPPEISIFFSFPAAKNPTDFPSDDQKGYVPLPVPCNGCTTVPSSGRTHNWFLPSSPVAENTMRLPSGEREAVARRSNDVVPGAGIVANIAPVFAAGFSK